MIKGAQGTVTILDRATKPLQSIANAFKNMGKASSSTNTDLSKTQKAIDGISTAQNRLNRVNENIKRSTKDIGSQAVGVVAMGLAIKQALQPAIDFESAMADVKKVVDFETPQQFEQMQKDILNLSKTIPLANEGIAALVAAGGQAGFARKDLIAFATDAGKMAVAFDNLAAADAGEMMAKWRTAFSMNQDEVRKLADQINYLSNVTASSTTTIADIVTRVGSLGGVAGVSSESLAAIGTTMTSVGVQSEIAATGIQNLLLSLVAGKAATKTQQEAFKALGMTSENIAKGMQKDSTKTILTVLEGVKKMDATKQAAMLQMLFGKESIKSIAPLLTNLDKLKENFASVGDSSKFAGSMQKEFVSRSDTTANKLQLLNNNVSALTIIFSKGLLPTIKKVIDSVGALLAPVGKLLNDFPLISQSIGAFIAVVMVAKVASLAYTAALWLVAPAISALSMGLKIAKVAMLAFNLAMTLNPIGLIVAGVGLLIAAGVALYKNWEPVSTFFKELWETIKGLGKSFASLPSISSITDFAGGAFDKVSNFFGGGEAPVMAPAVATQSIQKNAVNNVPVSVHVNIADGKVKGMETSGSTKTDLFLNNGRQN